MSKARLFSTAAAIVLLSGSAAMAQGLTPGGDNPARAPAVQQTAPAEKMGPAIQRGQHKRPETTGQALPDRVEPGHGANVQTNQANPQPRKAPETTGQNGQQHEIVVLCNMAPKSKAARTSTKSAWAPATSRTMTARRPVKGQQAPPSCRMSSARA